MASNNLEDGSDYLEDGTDTLEDGTAGTTVEGPLAFTLEVLAPTVTIEII